jgi:hypothetical protein
MNRVRMPIIMIVLMSLVLLSSFTLIIGYKNNQLNVKKVRSPFESIKSFKLYGVDESKKKYGFPSFAGVGIPANQMVRFIYIYVYIYIYICILRMKINSV